MSISMAAEAAESYKTVSVPQKKDALLFLDRLQLRENSKVLDIGCGTGCLASVMAERVGPKGMVVGVDPDEERIKLAQESYSTQSNLAFLKGSDKEFPEDQYDLITSTHVLHWVKDKETMFKLVYRNLKPGGQFAFVVAPERAPILSQLFALMGPERSKNINEKMYILADKGYEKIATEVGFVVDYKSVEPSVMSLTDITAVIEWAFASTNGMFDPAVIDKTTLKDFTNAYGDGPVDVSYRVITMILIK